MSRGLPLALGARRHVAEGEGLVALELAGSQPAEIRMRDVPSVEPRARRKHRKSWMLRWRTTSAVVMPRLPKLSRRMERQRVLRLTMWT